MEYDFFKRVRRKCGEPFFENEHCMLYHGDSADLLPYMPHFDGIITDPPYGINYFSNRRCRTKHKRISGDHELPVDLIKLSIKKGNCFSYVFCRWDNLCELPRPRSVIAWVKRNHTAGDLQHEHGRRWEACCFYPGVHHRFRKRPEDVIFCRTTGNKHHPTEKPVELLRDLLRANYGHSVLDTFAGSGSTLIAAKGLGMKSVGIEIDHDYCELIVSRLTKKTIFSP